ncbi:hypothetical protein [Kordia sp.]|uniref:hypothetical protein n=1 Tax=Kordia sp. TaxID=1965332 RepID=UPI003D6B0FFE
MFGIVYKNYTDESNKLLVYFGSQMTLIFLLLYKTIQIPYYWIFKRRPEVLTIPEKNIDIIPSLILIVGSVILPFIIDSFIIRKLM